MMKYRKRRKSSSPTSAPGRWWNRMDSQTSHIISTVPKKWARNLRSLIDAHPTIWRAASLTISTPLWRSTPDIVRFNAASVRAHPISIILAVCSGKGANSIRGRNKQRERWTPRNFSQFSPGMSLTFFSVRFSFWRQNERGKWLKAGARRLIPSHPTLFHTPLGR